VRLIVRGSITSARTTTASVLKFDRLTIGPTMSSRNGADSNRMGVYALVGDFSESVTSLRLCNLPHMCTIREFQLLQLSGMVRVTLM